MDPGGVIVINTITSRAVNRVVAEAGGRVVVSKVGHTSVKALMAEHELDALVVRAPDNVLYLTNFWGMKGYDAAVFPREGDPALICLEASEADAERMAWTTEVRLFHGYDENDPRPPGLRALDLARQLSSEYDRVGIGVWVAGGRVRLVVDFYHPR